MSTSTKPNWLQLAEQESAAEQAKATARDETWASGIAQTINDRLATLKITPLNRATTDGQGHVIPAILLCAVPDEGLYDVHAAFDEDSSEVTLLGAAHDDPELRRLNLSISYCEPALARSRILHAHRTGPAPLPPKPAPLSPDAAAVVDVLRDIYVVLDSINRHGIGQL